MGADGILSGHGSLIADLHVEIFYAEPFLDGHNRMKEALTILGRIVEVIGDAECASKARDAVDHAFRTALLADRERARDRPGQDGQLRRSEGSASKYVTQLLAWQRLNKG